MQGGDARGGGRALALAGTHLRAAQLGGQALGVVHGSGAPDEVLAQLLELPAEFRVGARCHVGLREQWRGGVRVSACCAPERREFRKAASPPPAACGRP